jgi:hypothetical protein
MKKTGTVYKGSANPKADVTLLLSDASLVDLASGKVTSHLILASYCLILFAVERSKSLDDGET